MAHPCSICQGECNCSCDIDDVVVCFTPLSCQGCGCEDQEDEELFYDEPEFHECDKCAGHPACEDFGCAIKAGLGHLVKKDFDSSDL